MSTTKQRLAKWMTVAARVIVLGATAFWLLASMLSLMWRTLYASDILFLIYFGIALVGCIISWWRQWLAGILLVLVSFALGSSLGSSLGFSSPWGAPLVKWSPQLGLPFLVAGVLFLISSWLLRPWLGHLPLPRQVFVLMGIVSAFLVVPFLILLCVEFIGGEVIFFPGLHTKEVAVEIGDGWVKSEPAPSGRYNYITFKVNNVGSETHMLVVLETSLDPRDFPVENGQVRGYAYIDEPEWTATRTSLLSGYGLIQYPFKVGEIPPGVSPPTPNPIAGVLIAPGESAIVKRWGSYMQPFQSGTGLVLFCNYPGHYERGEYTTLTIP